MNLYRLLIDAAQDGAALPWPLGSTRLGEERTQVHSSALAGEGFLYETFRERKLMDYYLEPAAQKNGLSLSEADLLLRLHRSGSGTRKELADFAGLTKSGLSILLQRLSAKGLIATAEARTGGSEKQLQISFTAAAEAVLTDVEKAYEDFEAARLSGFTEEERARYAQLTSRIQDDIRSILQ